MHLELIEGSHLHTEYRSEETVGSTVASQQTVILHWMSSPSKVLSECGLKGMS